MPLIAKKQILDEIAQIELEALRKGTTKHNHTWYNYDYVVDDSCYLIMPKASDEQKTLTFNKAELNNKLDIILEHSDFYKNFKIEFDNSKIFDTLNIQSAETGKILFKNSEIQGDVNLIFKNCSEINIENTKFKSDFLINNKNKLAI